MNQRRLKWTIGVLALTFCAGVLAADDPEIVKLTIMVCANCHGQYGDSNSSAFPRLAGQNATYIESQLKAFKEQTRGDPTAIAYMWGMASQLDEATMKRLGAYYSSQRPNPGRTGDSARMSMGKEIYDKGVLEAGIPGCISCHGDNAQGKELIPRLGGQHPEYLLKQLAAFKSLQRSNAPVMHAVTDKMNFDQMRSVTEYAASK